MSAANNATVSRQFTIRANGANLATTVTCTVAASTSSCTSVGSGTIPANAAVDLESKTVTGGTVASAQDALFGWECQK